MIQINVGVRANRYWGGMRTYFASRLHGVVFIEYHAARRAAPPFYAHENHDGEHLFWLGRLHLIYTPARIAFGVAAPVTVASPPLTLTNS